MKVANRYFNLTALVQHLAIALECLSIINCMIFQNLNSLALLDIYYYTKASECFKHSYFH